ncbi:MAG: hypothetical protein IIW69_08135 [Bacteroidaceae bacterium]|nr:hypothetical protein [Bacteroidaceae bacterium]
MSYIKCTAIVRCHSFEEAQQVAALHGYADNVLRWEYVLRGEPIFTFSKYNHYVHGGEKTFAFFLTTGNLIWDFGPYEGNEDRCPEKFHYDADYVLRNFFGESFQSDDLEVLLNA